MSGRTTPTGPPGSDDGEVDAWLREALRHAPDAAARPSEPTSATILATARAATRQAGAPSAAPSPRPSAGAGRGLGRAWSIFWDGLTRPAVAAGMASVMVATVVGLMWWGQPLDDATPTAPPSVGRPSTPSQGAGSAAEKPAPAAERAEEHSAPQASAFPAEPSVSGRARNEDIQLRRREAPDGALNEAAKAERKLAAPARPAPATPPPPSDESRAERSAEPSAGRQRSTMAGPAVAPSDAPAAADALAGLTALRVDALASLSMALARDGHRWSRSLPTGERAEVDDAFRRWLGDVEAASRARRQPASPGARRDEPTADDETVVRLLRDGRLAAVVRIAGAAVSLESFEGGAATLQRWSLAPQAAARLRQTLPPP